MRLTLDEAIAHAKEVAEEKYNEGFLCYANPDDGKLDGCVKCAQKHEQLAEWLTQLKEYQQLEEQGRLFKLPCKVGARLYWIGDEDDYGHKEMCIKQYSESEKVTGFSLGEDGEVLVFIGYDNSEPDVVGERYALLTRESAEAKLKELRDGERMKLNE